MAIVFCPSCDGSVYLVSSDQQICPVCSGSLSETEEVIRDRLASDDSSPLIPARHK